MHLNELAITHFRCLNQVNLAPSSNINLFLGANGAGKTSVLEAVFCLSRGRSFRANSLNKLIQDEKDFCVVRAKLLDDIPHQLAIQANRDSKLPNYVAKIDGEPIKTLSELSYLLPTIVLDPAIHQLIEEGPKHRRQFIDWGVFHVEPDFILEWRRYQRALKQRNAGLKKDLPYSQLKVWTDILLESGLFIDRSRKAYIESITPIITQFATELLDTEIKLTYRSGWSKELEFEQALEKSRAREQKSGLTLVGPHRADLNLKVGDLVLTTNNVSESEASDHFHKVQQRVSRGQQKLIAASMKLAQANLFKRQHQVSPVLLIDDPFAELDTDHANRLLQEIEKLKAQTFITALHTLPHPLFQSAKKFHVEHGSIQEIID
jgi:DNA replication and repair protein RecF